MNFINFYSVLVRAFSFLYPLVAMEAINYRTVLYCYRTTQFTVSNLVSKLEVRILLAPNSRKESMNRESESGLESMASEYKI